MLLDNSDNEKSVFQWIEKYTEDGTFHAVTGYFTIGVLAYLSKKINEKITEFRMVLGEITSKNEVDFKPLNLLNEVVTIDTAFRLSKTAEEAVKFLKQDKVFAKTLEPNFCHAKLYLHESHIDPQRNNYFITGSSNLTEAGIGLKHTSNAELNIADHGQNLQYNELRVWFDNLWNSKALDDKTIDNGKRVNFKKYLINEISSIFKKYTPNDIYFKILAELVSEPISEEMIHQKIKNTAIYQTLFRFQKKAVASLIRMLENYNGAILADAVGLGKTFTALAVIKYYKREGRETIVLAPKKLQYNWEQYKKYEGSILEEDKFDYLVKFHTDLNEFRMENNIIFLTNETPKLIVIDESHNLRNDKSSRYNFLLENILMKNQNIKVLMLSATPINNSFIDIRNQFKLIPEPSSSDLPYDRLAYIFKKAQEKLDRWAKAETPMISNLLKDLPDELTKFTDSLIVARTRSMIANTEIVFPKLMPPKNIYETPICIEKVSSFGELIDLLPIRFSAYLAAVYAGMTDERVIYDESRRSLFLVKMLHILLIKRLESSWFSFKITVEKILNYHIKVLNIVGNACMRSEDINAERAHEFTTDDDLEDIEEYTIGTKKIMVKDIVDIEKYKNDLKEDISKLQFISDELNKFSSQRDSKLIKLIDVIKDKQARNPQNIKVLIFTTYTGTANYLSDELDKHFDRTAVVTGGMSNKVIDNILKRFSPISKNAVGNAYMRSENDPIDILIATDTLSEGQNLQDCDMVINYDIHWNPVRAIQRLGRIDRIGSKNETITCINFWPTKDINEYLDLQKRVERRMVAMTIAGSQIPKGFTELIDTSETNAIQKRQEEKNMKIMEEDLSRFEAENLGLNNLTMENFKQDLTNETRDKYNKLPNGIFSGFKTVGNACMRSETACMRSEKMDDLTSERIHAFPTNLIIVLLSNKKDNDKRLIYIDEDGNELFSNQFEILQFLQVHKDGPRFVSKQVDSGEEIEISKLSNAIKNWLKKARGKDAEKTEKSIFDGSISLKDIRHETTTIEQKFEPQNWEIICWEIIS